MDLDRIILPLSHIERGFMIVVSLNPSSFNRRCIEHVQNTSIAYFGKHGSILTHTDTYTYAHIHSHERIHESFRPDQRSKKGTKWQSIRFLNLFLVGPRTFHLSYINFQK